MTNAKLSSKYLHEEWKQASHELPTIKDHFASEDLLIIYNRQIYQGYLHACQAFYVIKTASKSAQLLGTVEEIATDVYWMYHKDTDVSLTK
jgi:hypothetical protein